MFATLAYALRAKRLSSYFYRLAGVLALALPGAVLSYPITNVVTTQYGKVQGANLAAYNGASVKGFMGIPYAAAPAGNLRWRAPVAPSPWTTTRIAHAFGNSCPQPPRPEFTVNTQGEDCLNVNVWTTAADTTEKKPVMVWIHGGGLYSGSAPSGVHLAGARNVVVVTFNYRLGALGFLAHPLLSTEASTQVSGNYGILDQIFALKWVRANITRFGGDPANITVFGVSAGGTSITALMTSPQAKGRNLMHKVIVMSASQSRKLRFRNQVVDGMQSMESKGVAFERSLLGLGGGDILARMRAKTAKDILAKWDRGAGEPGDGTGAHLSVDGYVLKEVPSKVFYAGRQMNLPIITGTVAAESISFSTTINTVLEFTNFVSDLLNDSSRLINEMLALYPASTNAQAEASYVNYSNDLFVCPIRHQARMMAAIQPNTYLYQFRRVSLQGLLSGRGAFHASDVPYVFHDAAGAGGFTPEDEAVSEQVMAYYSTFASTGNPQQGDGSSRLWPPYQTATDKHQILDYPMRTGQGLRKLHCDFLDREIFRLSAP